MQGLVSRAAERDAAFVLAQDAGVWLEHRSVADLPATRRLPMPGDGDADDRRGHDRRRGVGADLRAHRSARLAVTRRARSGR